MINEKKIRLLWNMSVVGTTLFSLSFLLMPIASGGIEENNRKILILSGALFWITLLIGYGTWMRLVLLARRCPKGKNGRRRKDRPSVLIACAETVLIVSLVWIIISAFLEKNNSYSVYLCLCTCIMSLNTYGLFGGYIYNDFIKRKRREK